MIGGRVPSVRLSSDSPLRPAASAQSGLRWAPRVGVATKVCCSMSKAPVSHVGRVAFELDRFAFVGGGSYELQGRWFGVRGRRFMRPALTVVVDGQPIRLLADLAHKPWAAEDGEPWKAVFPSPADGGDLREAELTVGPDVTITLPAPLGRTAAKRKKLSADGADSSRPAGKRRAGGGSDGGGRAGVEPGERGQRASPTSGNGARGNELAVMRRELVDARHEQRRLQSQSERAEADKTQALARIDELMENLSEVTRQRDEASSARDRLAAAHEALESESGQVAAERDAARRDRGKLAAERDSAQRARDEALRASQVADVARDGALAERGGAVAAQSRAVAERDAGIAARDQAVTERDAALAVRSHALAERDAAVAARDDAVAERDALVRTTDRLQAELTDLVSARGAAMVMRRAAQERPASRPYARLLPGAVAVAILVLAAIVLVFVLG
jgi:hypothetical protein